MFVDYAGDTVPVIIHRLKGGERESAVARASGRGVAPATGGRFSRYFFLCDISRSIVRDVKSNIT
jgi:hypothetical protein